jgi:hypothetical protein
LTYKSKFEEEVAVFYKLHNKYEIEKLTYTLENVYNPDFKLTDNVFLEAKGYFKPSDRRKMIEVMKQHPDKKFIMLFQDSRIKLSRKSKITYGDWCDKNGIQWFCWKTKRPTKRVLSMAARTSTN